MMDQIIEFFAQQQVLFALLGLFLVLLLMVVVSKIKQSSANKQLKELEVIYNQAKSVPLNFKLNKAIALAKTNDQLLDTVADAQDKYLDTDKKLRKASIMLADIEDAILVGKSSQAKEWCEDTKDLLENIAKQVEELDKQFDAILEGEMQQRSKITKLKDEFRVCKARLASDAQRYDHSMQVLQDEVVAIENMFTSFEEWMYASEFEKAKEKTVEIEQNIEILKKQLDELPELIALTKGMLPTRIEDVQSKYNELKQQNIHVEHLDVMRNIDMVSSTLKDDLTQLRNGVLTNVRENTLESEKRLTQLKTALEHEEKAHDEATNLLRQLNDSIRQVESDYETLKLDIENVSYRYGLKAAMGVLEPSEQQLASSKESASKFALTLKENKVPATAITTAIKEETNKIQQLQQQITSYLQQFAQAKNDEARANKQLLKLHLIVNEIQVKIRKHRLPAISDSYRGDLNKSKQMIDTIQAILKTDPLDTRRLNTLVNESIDFIYKLYNNINNIVGMVDMIESGIVFANKYRSSMEFMDSELTRSELSFRNGEYTQALSTVLGAIEKLHPHSFEQLVKDNAKSASGV